MSATNQTVSFLKRRFAEAGVSINKRHGQNFLIDLNLLRLLADSAEVESNDVVLEVGTGTGALTSQLATRAGAVVSVEIDPAMYQLASEELIDFENVTLLHQDALKNKNTLDPKVLELVRERLAATPDSRFKLAANLPYNVATPIISNLLLADPTPVSMTVTIQKELADRITARPSTKDYSALSLWVQSQCEAEVIRVMPPEVFWPRPKVHSAILKLTVDPVRRAKIADLQFWHLFLRSMFFHRRKFLRSVVISAYKDRLDKAAVDEILAAVGLEPTGRAEQFTVDELFALSEAIRHRLA